MKLRVSTGRLSVIILISSVCSFAPRTVGQISGDISEERRARIEAFQERERGMAQDPSRKRPPLPDDSAETDVAKRRSFVSALNRQRINFMCFQHLDSLKEAAHDIPQEKKESLLERFSTLVGERLGPNDPTSVQWYANWADYGDRDAEGNFKLSLRLYVAEWSVEGVIVRASQLATAETHVRVLIRTPKRPSLRLRSIPADFPGESWDWEYVSKGEVYRVIAEQFGFPFGSDEDFELHGYVTSSAGVTVYTGKISPAGVARGDAAGQKARAERPRAWQRMNRILMTASDPQYVCISFDLNENENVQSPKP